MTISVTCSDKNVTFVIEGSCNACGDCCKLFCAPCTEYMFSADAYDSNYCKYLTEDSLCYVQLLKETEEDLSKEIATLDLSYWEMNCRDWPSYLNKQNATMLFNDLKKKEWPTVNCGYTLTVISDADSS